MLHQIIFKNAAPAHTPRLTFTFSEARGCDGQKGELGVLLSLDSEALQSSRTFALREKIDASSPDFDPPPPFAGGAWAESRRGPFARGALAPWPVIPGSAIPSSPAAPATFVLALPLRPFPFFGPLNFDITSSGFSRRSFLVILSTALRPFFIVDFFFSFWSFAWASAAFRGAADSDGGGRCAVGGGWWRRVGVKVAAVGSGNGCGAG